VTTSGSPRRDGLLLAVLYVGLALLLWRAHYENVDSPARAKKLALHEAVLENRAPDPYEYKLWTITWAAEAVHRATGFAVFDVYAISGLLSLLALLAAHHRWLSQLFGRRSALLGTLLLGALAHALFLDYYHHPYDLWGVAGFCLLLAGIARRASIVSLCALALLVGVVWEKHALLPLVWLLLSRRDGKPWGVLLPRAAAFFLFAVAIPVAIRLALGGHRDPVDGDSPLSKQDWFKVLWHQLPYVVPFVVILVASWRQMPPLVRLLWIYVPAMFSAYACSQFILYEVRSFWAFAPIFTATAVAWASGLSGDDKPAGASSA
jgi:hypothetical protein